MPRIGRAALLDGSFHHHLLRDSTRLHAYAKSIAASVRAGDVVADIGSGSGVLAFLAVKAGARRVFAIESNTHSYGALLRNVRHNGVVGLVVPVLADGLAWSPPEPVDVVVCELMETGLLHEPIVDVMQHVASWHPRPRAVLPREARLLVEGVEVLDTFHGYRAAFPGWRASEGDEPLTDLCAYATVDFENPGTSQGIDASFTLRVTRAGMLGGIQLRTETSLADSMRLQDGPAYCTPLVLTLDAPFQVHVGERLDGRIRYDFAYTDEPVEFELSRSASS